MVITREYLLSLLDAWQQNKITAAELYEAVSTIYFPGTLKFIDWEGKGEDETSLTNVVLAYLDFLNIDFITQEDIEPCKEFLHTPIGCFEEGWKKWQDYKSSINYEERMKKLKGQPPYIN